MILRILVILLCIIGLAKVVRSFLPLTVLQRAGNAFAASPLPRPFLSVRLGTHPGDGIFFACRNSLGASARIRWDRDSRLRLEGPHRRIVYFLNFVSSLHERNIDSFLPVLGRFVCRDLGPEFGCPANSDHHEIEFVLGRYRLARELPCG